MFNNLLKNISAYFLLLFVLLFSLTSTAQEQDIKGVFDQIMEDHTTWEIYKVVPVSKMNNFGQALGDTLAQKEETIASLNNEVASLNVSLDSANAKIGNLNSSLYESNAINDQIVFLGITFSKTAYNVLVWLKMFVLLGLLIFTYFMYKRSHMVTSAARKELADVKAQLEAQKEKTRDKEQRLKRELQTAVNKLYEHGIQA